MRNNSTTLDAFLDVIAEGQPAKQALGLSDDDFTQASFEQLLQNPDDIGDGVTKVETKFDSLFFGLFDSVLVKHQENRTRYIFYTQTRDTDFIQKTVSLLGQKFGTGWYDDKKVTPFTETDKIISLSKGKYLTKRDELFQTWLYEGGTVSLSYKVSPMRQLVLQVSQKVAAQPDKTVRNKGTVADLLYFDLNQVLQQQELDREIETESGNLKFIDYFFKLAKPEFGIFDLIKVRIFGPDKEFNRQDQVNITLSTSDTVDYRQTVQVAERLIKMYGPDHIGSEQLEADEVDDLQGDYWMGRMWNLNEVHAPWHPDNADDKMAYGVSINHRENDNGFTLHILAYNSLLNLFTTK